MPTAGTEKQQPDKVVEKNPKSRQSHSSEREAKKRVASCGQKARSLRRLLEHRKDFPEDVQARMLADAEALEQRHRQRVKELKRQKFIRAKKALYSKLKFYELKKVQRRLQQTRKELLALMSEQQEDQSSASAAAEDPSVSSAAADGEALGGRIADAQRRLRLHLDDLNYIRLYPADEPYVALFPAQDTEESQKKRQAMRRRILELVINSRKGNEADDDEEGGGDDMFVDAPEAEEAAAGADPFEGAQALSDEESGPGGGKAVQRHGGNKFHTKRTNRPRDIRHAGGAAVAARGKKGATCESEGQNPRCNSDWNRNHSSGRISFPPNRTGKQHSEHRDKGRSNKTQRQTPEQMKQKKQSDSSAVTKDTKNWPTRIGLSKQKATNQHVIFTSDEE